MKTAERSLLTFCLLTLVFSGTGFPADWPCWRGPSRNGISEETGWTAQWPADGPRQLWKANVGTGCSSVSVSEGRLFTMGNANETDTVFCLDAMTGREIWKHSYACPLAPNLFEGGPGSTPVVDAGRVYALSREGDLFCLEAASGKLLWKKNFKKDFSPKTIKWGYNASVLILNNLAIIDVGSPDAQTVAFDKVTGNVVWKGGSEPASYGTAMPFADSGRTLVTSFNGFGLCLLDAKDGREVARFPWKTQYEINAATPIISGNKIFISSGYNHGCALLEFQSGTLTKIWENKKMRNQFSSSVLYKDYLYGFDDKSLACLDFATGEEKWREEGLGLGSLMLADGKLIINSSKGELVLAEASPAGYKELARASVAPGAKNCWVVPVLANGRIYCKNNKGDLVCVDTGGK